MTANSPEAIQVCRSRKSVPGNKDNTGSPAIMLNRLSTWEFNQQSDYTIILYCHPRKRYRVQKIDLR